MSKLLGFILVLLAIALGIGLFLVWIGLAIGSANAWIIEGTFNDGWHAVWDRWLIATGWGILFLGGLGLGSGAGSRKA